MAKQKWITFTDKRQNRIKSSSLGLDLDKNTESIDLECRDAGFYYQEQKVELVSKELNHLAAILHVYAGGLNLIK